MESGEKKTWPQAFRDWFKVGLESAAAGGGRVACSVVIHPVNAAKVRLQSLSASSAVTSSAWLISDVKSYGPRVYYRGLTPACFSVFFKGLYKYPFFVYGPQELARLTTGDKDAFKKHPIFFQTAMTPFVVIVDTILQNPIRRLRNMSITSEEGHNLRTLNRELAQNPREYWRGASSAAVKQSLGIGSSLAVDAIARSAFHRRGWDTSHKNPYFFMATIFNGVFLSVVNTPLDVVSQRTTGKNPIPTTGFIPSVKYIWAREGMKAFTRGAGLRGAIYIATSVYTSMVLSIGRSQQSQGQESSR